MRALAAVLLVILLGACAPGPGDPVSIKVDAPAALLDQRIHVTVSGLDPGTDVVVTSVAYDRSYRSWNGSATFTADAAGKVDLDRSAPSAGTYTGADGMGLFWSMLSSKKNATFIPPKDDTAFTVRLAASTGGRDVAQLEVVRRLTSPGVTRQDYTVAADKIAGSLFLPPAGVPRGRPVLVFSGSDGGIPVSDAGLLASHGHPALALGYVNQPGTPKSLARVPLEYFVTAARLLQARAGSTGPVVADGYSRGTEAALLLADHFPQTFHGTLLYSPNNVVQPGAPGPESSPWTLGGQPVATLSPIPVDHLAGPVLAVVGGDDRVWQSQSHAEKIAAATSRRTTILRYPSAGHSVGTWPYAPRAATDPARFGGSAAADAQARADGWPRVLAWLATMPSAG